MSLELTTIGLVLFEKIYAGPIQIKAKTVLITPSHWALHVARVMIINIICCLCISGRKSVVKGR